MSLFLRLGVRTISFTVISPHSFSHLSVSLIDLNSTSVAASVWSPLLCVRASAWRASSMRFWYISHCATNQHCFSLKRSGQDSGSWKIIRMKGHIKNEAIERTLGLSGTNGRMSKQPILKTPCTADGSRHAHVDSIEPVPYVIPEAIRPPTYPKDSEVSNPSYFYGATAPSHPIPATHRN